MSSKCFPALWVVALVLGWPMFPAIGAAPEEPLRIGTGPNYLMDLHVVDNHWALRYKRQSVRRVLHPPVKHEGNPVIVGDGGFPAMARDPESGWIHLWYQTSYFDPAIGNRSRYAIAYARSRDGVNWERPELGLHEWRGTRANNIVWKGFKGLRASAPFLVQVPETDRRGHRFLLMYRTTDGMHLIGTDDGVHWDRESDLRICHLHSDTHNALVPDPERGGYVLYCRAKHIYRAGQGEMIDTGASRRMARLFHRDLWSEWPTHPQTLLVPDELDQAGDFNFFYGMPVRRDGGVFWGFLQCFKMNTDIHVELAYSRDGRHFERLPDRPKWISRGEEGAWDDGMVFAGADWVEQGDEWLTIYTGWDGPHESKDRTAGMGLARMRKEGFVSLRGPRDGGVVVTRTLLWPGGDLILNAEASKGEVQVRVSDELRKPVSGFDYGDGEPFSGDSVQHAVRWSGKSLGALRGRVVRLEFLLRDADLYTFRAGH